MPTEVHPSSTRVKRPIRVEGDVAYVTLTKGYVAVIDAADVPLVEGVSWLASLSKRDIAYAARTINGGTVYLHRVLMNPPEGMMVDHIDRDTLNCRRSNMRTVTVTVNNRNRGAWVRSSQPEGLTGVQPRGNRFRAKIGLGRRYKHLGTFDTPEEAHAAYREAATEHHGEFANHG